VAFAAASGSALASVATAAKVATAVIVEIVCFIVASSGWISEEQYWNV
jgi:hypothetical protein